MKFFRIILFLLAVLPLNLPTVFPQPASSLQGLVNIRFQNDIRLFTVMAALNAAGFDEETAGEEITGVRRAVRADLASLDPELKRRLESFYRERLQNQPDEEQPQAAYTSLALLLSGPPDFELQASDEEIPREARPVLGFERLAAEFYRSADVDRLWEKYRPAYDAELRAYEPVLRDVIQQTLTYFRVPARVVLDREIILIPDLLDKRDVVNARNLERIYYIVVGPSDSPQNNRRQLQHEYLHFLVDPLVRKFGVPLMDHQDLLDLAQRQPQIRSEYQNRYLLMVTESLIEALQLEMSGSAPEERERAIVDLFRRGLILTPYFHRGLQDYARSEMVSLPTFMEPLFQGVDPAEVRKDEERVAEMETRVRKQEATRRAQLEEARLEADRRRQERDLFREATALLQEGKMDAAEGRLQELLGLTPAHGGAWFYLAQISFQKGRYEDALEAYERSAEAVSSPLWVKAWSLLRIGRLLAAQGRLEEARSRFQAVTALQGDLRGAREQARESLAQLDRQP